MFEPLFEPVAIGNMKLKNRLIVPPMVTNFCTGGICTEQYIRHMVDKAKGGWSLLTMGQCVVSREGKGHPNQAVLNDPQCFDSLAELVERVHAAGAKISIQLNHAGRSSNSSITGMPLVCSSPLRDPIRKEIPQELSVEHIHEIVDQFGEAAATCKKLGFDAITEHAHARYLIATFLSPTCNKRSDEYGGSLYNRARFAIEILCKMREKVGEGFPIITRFSATECVEGGLSIMDTLSLAHLFEQNGADMLDISVGNAFSPYYITAPSIVDHGFVADIAEKFRAISNLPIAVAGRINDPCIADTILRTKKADLISMGRASIADPDLPNKLQNGNLDDIRYCIGCVQGCVGGIRQLKAISCLVNPRIGKEDIDVAPVRSKKKIAVIGGGVAGMQAAISSAERGLDVTLFERSGKLGGQWLAAAVPPGKSEFTTLVIWQKQKLKELKVDVRLNWDSSDIECLKQFSKVVLATGGTPIRPCISGVDKPHVMQAIDVLEGKIDTGRKIAVIGGGLVGTEVAIHLAYLGLEVSIIEMMDTIGAALEPSTRHFVDEEFKKYEIKKYVNSKVLEIKDDSVLFEHEGVRTGLTNIDTVVLALGSRPNTEILQNLRNIGIEPEIIGDAKKVRKGLEAVAEGYDVACNLKI